MIADTQISLEYLGTYHSLNFDIDEGAVCILRSFSTSNSVYLSTFRMDLNFKIRSNIVSCIEEAPSFNDPFWLLLRPSVWSSNPRLNAMSKRCVYVLW